LIGQDGIFLNGAHEAPTLLGLRSRRQKRRIARDPHSTLKRLAGMQHFAGRLSQNHSVGGKEESGGQKSGQPVPQTFHAEFGLYQAYGLNGKTPALILIE
jgi:hypothetical protein